MQQRLVGCSKTSKRSTVVARGAAKILGFGFRCLRIGRCSDRGGTVLLVRTSAGCGYEVLAEKGRDGLRGFPQWSIPCMFMPLCFLPLCHVRFDVLCGLCISVRHAFPAAHDFSFWSEGAQFCFCVGWLEKGTPPHVSVLLVCSSPQCSHQNV